MYTKLEANKSSGWVLEIMLNLLRGKWMKYIVLKSILAFIGNGIQWSPCRTPYGFNISEILQNMKAKVNNRPLSISRRVRSEFWQSRLLGKHIALHLFNSQSNSKLLCNIRYCERESLSTNEHMTPIRASNIHFCTISAITSHTKECLTFSIAYERA